jgi:hypothetical protein
MIMMRILPSCFVCALLTAALGIGSGALARVAPEEAFDVTLLRADAIAFVTVDRLVPADDDPESVDVFFEGARTIANKWSASGTDGALAPGNDSNAGAFVERIRVHGPQPNQDSVKILGSPFGFERGGRYLLFLQGGAWRDSPLQDGPEPFFQVVDDVVRCIDGGGVYGVSMGGMVCSTPDQQVGTPLTEEEVATLLERRLSHAAARRPDVAARFARARALQPSRSPAPSP